MRRPAGRSLRAVIGTIAFSMCAVAGATAYRCDDGGRITFTNLPCTSGKQTELTERATTPSPEGRAIAESRQRADRARLEAIERDRLHERKEDRRTAALTARRDAERMKQTQTCRKLALKARRAREDYESAGSRDQIAKRTRMRRAEEDYATACRKR